MRADIVTAITIETETHSRRFSVVFFDADYFHQSMKTAEKRRHGSAQIHQNLVMDERLGDVIDDDGCY
jgi:hypothetical protein